MIFKEKPYNYYIHKMNRIEKYSILQGWLQDLLESFFALNPWNQAFRSGIGENCTLYDVHNF